MNDCQIVSKVLLDGYDWLPGHCYVAAMGLRAVSNFCFFLSS